MGINKAATQISELDAEVIASGRMVSKHAALPAWMAALSFIVLAAYLAVLMARFAYRGELYLSFFTDDFFYYLVVAKNLALHGTSTFNGLQPTNGYHPLWFLTITLLYRVFGNHLSFFVALLLLIWLLVCGSYWALRRTQSSLNIGGDIGLGFALLSTTFMAVISRTGMEVSLALFFLILLWKRMAAQPLESQTPAGAFLSGLLASALVLSRLDACLVVAAYGALTLIRPSGTRRTAMWNLIWFCAGLFPVAVYIAINQIEFGTLLPISGMAKNLKSTLLPSGSTVGTLGRHNIINILFTWPSIALCALYVWHLLQKSEEPSQLGSRRVQLCVLLHPVIFYTVLSFSSDWAMWTWYLYPLVPVGALLGPVLLTHRKPFFRIPILWLTAAVGFGSLLVIFNLARINRLELPIYQQALMLQEFAASHPGRYAMGDAAGTPAYLMSMPILQLEGLMGDKAFLQRIRRQEPLLQALDELGVDYYISTAAKPDGSCYDVREPAEAGPRSPAMQAHLCLQPVLDIRPPGATDTLVFDLRERP